MMMSNFSFFRLDLLLWTELTIYTFSISSVIMIVLEMMPGKYWGIRLVLVSSSVLWLRVWSEVHLFLSFCARFASR